MYVQKINKKYDWSCRVAERSRRTFISLGKKKKKKKKQKGQSLYVWSERGVDQLFNSVRPNLAGDSYNTGDKTEYSIHSEETRAGDSKIEGTAKTLCVALAQTWYVDLDPFHASTNASCLQHCCGAR